ncbi:MAG: YigZ family protein [Helicobacteraceae bacterium]|nr:YigZ family protein [Helicobacteraceae bacterium]
MFCVESIFCADYKKDNSTFIAYLMPFSCFESHLENLKVEHKKAVHFVRATRILNIYNQIIEQSSDDGEPKGSSGVPVLNVMRGNKLVNCAIVVVRYFGGKLLGVGGLVRAYTQASLNVINIANLINYDNLESFSLEVPLNTINKAKYLAKKLEINSIKFDFMQNFAIIRIVSTKSKIDEFLHSLKAK